MIVLDGLLSPTLCDVSAIRDILCFSPVFESVRNKLGIHLMEINLKKPKRVELLV